MLITGLRLASVALLAMALAGCGGGGNGSGGSGTSAPPPPAPQTTVSGVVFASDVFTSGVVKAYDFTSGTQGGLLASATIGITGTYQLTVPASSGAILIEADSGCYTERAIPWATSTGEYPSVQNEVTASICPSSSSPSLSAAVPVPAGAVSLVVAVTPYTHATVGLAEYEIRNGNTTINALIDANSRLSTWVGTNIQATLPTTPTLTSTLSDSTLYGSLLSGIPSWLRDVATTSPAVFGTGTLTTIAFADAMKSDLAQDGVFNGVGRDANGNAVPLVIGNSTLSTTIYRHEMAYWAVIRVRAETEGAVSPTSAEQTAIVGFLPSFVAYNDAVNSLVDASAVVALDEGGPVVTVTYPSAGATLSGNGGLAGFVHDVVGIAQGNTVMLIDGVYYTWFVNQYMPNHFINTTIFPNGSHVLTIKSTNNLGHVGTASITVNFFN